MYIATYIYADSAYNYADCTYTYMGCTYRLYRKVWLISACAYFVSGKKLCTYYMYALITCMCFLRVCKTRVLNFGPAQPKHYRTAMRAFLPPAVLY